LWMPRVSTNRGDYIWLRGGILEDATRMFIFFDIDDTLGDHESAVQVAVSRFLEHFAHELRSPREQFLNTWSEVSEKNNELYLQGKISLLELKRNRMREVFAQTGQVLSNEDADRRFQIYHDQYESNWKLFDDVLPCLDRLGADHLGLISNG